MKINELVKHGAIAFLIAAVVYVGMYSWIQHKREYRGPWEIKFESDSNGIPSLTVHQPSLNLPDHKITIADQKITETNLNIVIRYDKPMTNTPFGEIAFQDPTFLPGTITFNLWGHGVEFMPRTMVIDQQEVAWRSQTNIVLSGKGKFERRVGKKPFFQ